LAAPYARYLHVSDARDGYNLKILKMSENLEINLDFAAYLVYFPDTADFLLLDPYHPIYFYDEKPSTEQKKKAAELADRVKITAAVEYIDYNGLYAGSTQFDDEIFTYLISVPGLSFDVLERARPIIVYLRSTKDSEDKSLMDKMVANTITGIVHFHEIPGEGTLDFEASFKALKDNGFTGYASVELYHHVTSWEKALTDSFKHLSQYTDVN
jgi:Sugar phosphate isomerases/epimerases